MINSLKDVNLERIEQLQMKREESRMELTKKVTEEAQKDNEFHIKKAEALADLARLQTEAMERIMKQTPDGKIVRKLSLNSHNAAFSHMSDSFDHARRSLLKDLDAETEERSFM